MAAANPPTAGEKSAALPVGTGNGNSGAGFEDRSLDVVPGAAGVTKSLAALAQTAHQDGYIARFTSKKLAAQTITANTWTLRLARVEQNAAANAFTICSVYVWRPGTASVVGYIYDSDTALGTEWPTTEAAQAVSLSGAAVTVQDNDVLVLEVWVHAVQGMATAYSRSIGLNDADGTTRGSYLETPQNLTFASQTIVIGQALETDLAQALTRRKVRAVGQVLETDLSQAVGRLKRRVVAQTLEADVAQPLVLPKIVTVLQVIETDLAQAVGRLKAKLVGQALETDLAQPVRRNPLSRLIGMAVETDLAQAVTAVVGGGVLFRIRGLMRRR